METMIGDCLCNVDTTIIKTSEYEDQERNHENLTMRYEMMKKSIELIAEHSVFDDDNAAHIRRQLNNVLKIDEIRFQ